MRARAGSDRLRHRSWMLQQGGRWFRSVSAIFPIGIAISLDGRRASVTNNKLGALLVVDLARRKVVTRIPAVSFPTGSPSPDGGKIFVPNNAPGRTVIDAPR